MIPAWLLAVGVVGGVVVVAAASKKPKSRPGINVDLPEPEFHDPNALPEPAPMTADAFKAELAERYARLADAVDYLNEPAIVGTSAPARALAMSYMLGVRDVNGLTYEEDGIVRGPQQHPAEAAFVAGAPVWEAYAEFFSPEERQAMWAFAKYGHQSMVGAFPPWAKQFKTVGLDTKRRVARWMLGESSETAALFG